MTLLAGVDSGFSKTAAVLCDSDGRVLATVREAGCALQGAPSASQRDLLHRLTGELCRQASVERDNITAWGAGLNGIDFPDEFDAQHRSVAAAMGVDPARLHLVNDGIAALWGATGAPAAVMIQHGSGLTSTCRTAAGSERIFDHLDVGRLFDMRQALIARVARMLDGRAARTTLADRLLEHLGIDDPAEYAVRVYRQQVRPDALRNTPPLIYAAWQEGDAAAAELVNDAIEDYARLAGAIARCIDAPAYDIVFGGGCVRYAPVRFWELLESRLRDAASGGTMRQAIMTPEFGGAVMAGFKAGVDWRRLFERLVEHGRPSAAVKHAAI